MRRDEIDELVGKINSLIDEGTRPSESDDSVGIGTRIYDAPQGFSVNKDEDDTP
jgi:hypothetical protein